VSSVVRYSRAAVLSVVLAVAFASTSGLSPRLDQVKEWGVLQVCDRFSLCVCPVEETSICLQVFWIISPHRWSSEAMVGLTGSGQPNQRVLETAADSGYNVKVSCCCPFVPS
jgi:hypothetical protein